MTQKEIIDELANYFTDREEAKKVYQIFCGFLNQRLANEGDSVVLKDVGVLRCVMRKPRTVVNPVTGNRFMIPASKHVVFHETKKKDRT